MSPGPSWLPHGWNYILPMAVFLLFIQFGSWFEHLYPLMYVSRAIVVAALLVWLWRTFTPIRWTHLWLGVAVGVAGIVQWLGMQKLLMLAATHVPALKFTCPGSPDDAFNPLVYFKDYPAWVLWTWVALRWASASLVVPVMEELFWRDWLWRTIAAPNDFRMVPVGEDDRTSFWVVPLVFSCVHLNWWLTSIVWALMISWLLVRTKSLGACIVAHGVTNFLLGAYVLRTGDWYFW